MAKRIDLIDVMFAVHKGELKVVEKDGFFLCTKSFWCNLLMMKVNANWFCSHGKRRDNDATK